MSSMQGGGGCENCGGTFRDGEDWWDRLPCENAVQRAVREEREAVERYLRTQSGWDHAVAVEAFDWMASEIERGEHRK